MHSAITELGIKHAEMSVKNEAMAVSNRLAFLHANVLESIPEFVSGCCEHRFKYHL